MQSQCLRYRVDQGEIRHSSGDNVAHVQLEEVPIPNDGAVAHHADIDEDEEDDGDEEEEGSEEGPSLACSCSSFDLLARKLWCGVCRSVLCYNHGVFGFPAVMTIEETHFDDSLLFHSLSLRKKAFDIEHDFKKNTATKNEKHNSLIKRTTGRGWKLLPLPATYTHVQKQ